MVAKYSTTKNTGHRQTQEMVMYPNSVNAVRLKNKLGQFGSLTHKFLICNPVLELDHILLGLDILEAMQAEIKCDNLKISAQLLDNDNKSMKMELSTISSRNANAFLSNISPIKAGQSCGIFSINNSENANLNQCKITSTNSTVKLPFEAVILAEGKALGYKNAIYPIQEQSLYTLPIEASSEIPAGELILNLEQVQFKYEHDEIPSNSCQIGVSTFEQNTPQGCQTEPVEKAANIPDTSFEHNLELGSLSVIKLKNN